MLDLIQLMDGWLNWLITQLIGWFKQVRIPLMWLIDWLIDGLIDWGLMITEIDWLVDWLTDWLTGWLRLALSWLPQCSCSTTSLTTEPTWPRMPSWQSAMGSASVLSKLSFVFQGCEHWDSRRLDNKRSHMTQQGLRKVADSETIPMPTFKQQPG